MICKNFKNWSIEQNHRNEQQQMSDQSHIRHRASTPQAQLSCNPSTRIPNLSHQLNELNTSSESQHRKKQLKREASSRNQITALDYQPTNTDSSPKQKSITYSNQTRNENQINKIIRRRDSNATENLEKQRAETHHFRSCLSLKQRMRGPALD